MRTMKGILIAGLVVLLGACTNVATREDMGAGIGAIAGGLLLNQVGGGRGRVIATATGAVVGALVGSAIGRQLDAAAQAEMDRATHQALETATIGGSGVQWESPAASKTQAHGQIEILRQGRGGNGRPCREYRQKVTIGDKAEEMIGTACRRSDGVWEQLES